MMAEKMYARLKADGTVEDAPHLENNMKLLFPDVDFETSIPGGWVVYERRFQDSTKLPSRYFTPKVSSFFENGVWVENHYYEEVTDSAQKKMMRDAFYAEEHATAAIFDEAIGAWMRPSKSQLDSMSGSVPNVIE